MRSTCALTGHRDLPESFQDNALYDALEGLILSGCDTFLCGMAAGFDLRALGCLVSLKEKYKIYIEACVPFAGQEKSFPPEEKRKYRDLIDWCDRKTVLFENFGKGCYLARNRYMVDCSDFVFAYFTHAGGGTAYTVKYAEEKGINVIFFDPEK